MRDNAQMSVEELCRKLRPVMGEKIEQIYSQYMLADSMETKREIEQVLNIMYQKHLNSNMLNEKVLLEPPQQEVIKGDYPLGRVIYPDEELYSFGLRERDFPRHILVTGMSGSGKTNFAYVALGGFILKKKPFMVFDWKRSFRPLMKVNKDLLLFTVGNSKISNVFRFNINRPPKNVNPKEWIMALCDIISEVFMTSFGVHKLLSEVIDKAYVDFGVYNGTENYPTWFQIKDRLEELNIKHGREAEWLTSATRIAHTLTFGDFGESINYKGDDAMTVDELLNKQVLFEMNSLSTTEKKFFADFILTYIYKLKKANDETTQTFNHAIIVDEAHNIFLREKANFNTESITDMIYREIREYGTSLICLDQHISKLSEVVVGNSASIIGFQQFLPSDLGVISGSMQIFEKKKFFSMLPVGYAIVRLVERYQSPFLIKVPFIDIKAHSATDIEVREMMRVRLIEHKRMKGIKEGMSIEKLQKEIAKMDHAFKKGGIAHPEPEFIHANVKEKIRQDGDTPLTRELAHEMAAKEMSDSLGVDSSGDKIIFTQLKQKLTTEETKFLQTLQREPNTGTAQIYKYVGLSVRKGNQIRDRLLSLGLLEVKEERNSSGWKKVFQLTQLAQDLLLA